MRVPRLDAPRLLIVGVLLIAAGVVVRCGVQPLMWSTGDGVYGVGISFGLLDLALGAVDQVLVPLGAAFVAGAFVLAALAPREQGDFPPQY